MPGDLVAIPPLWRTVAYYVLGVANVVVGSLFAFGHIDGLAPAIVSGVSAVLFGVAGSHVTASPNPAQEG